MFVCWQIVFHSLILCQYTYPFGIAATPCKKIYFKPSINKNPQKNIVYFKENAKETDETVVNAEMRWIMGKQDVPERTG